MKILKEILMRLNVGVCILLAQLPWGLQMWLGRQLGKLLFHTMKTRRHVAEVNLKLCFPDKTYAERADLLQQHFLALGMGAFEFIRAWWGRTGKTAPDVVFEGGEILERLEAEGSGVLLISGHFTCFEMCGRLLSERYPTAAMYREQNSKVLDRAIYRGREHYAIGLFTRDELRPAFKFLKKAGRLWYAPDQDMIGKDNVFVPFLGVPANTITATAQMARVSGAKVVPFGLRRTPTGYAIKVGEPLENFPSKDAEADARAVNEMLEDLVQMAPEQYLWIHRRFKRRPEGEPSVY